MKRIKKIKVNQVIRMRLKIDITKNNNPQRVRIYFEVG